MSTKATTNTKPNNSFFVSIVFFVLFVPAPQAP